MLESKYPPVLTLRYDKVTKDYVGEFPGRAIESFRGVTITGAMDVAAMAVRRYKADVDVTGARLAEIDDLIRHLQIEKQQLESEQASAEASPIPLYSLLKDSERAIYVVGIKMFDPEYIKWYEARFKCTVIQINLIESPEGDPLCLPLIWQWVILNNEDTDDG